MFSGLRTLSARAVADGDGDAGNAPSALRIPPPWGIRPGRPFVAGCGIGLLAPTRNLAESQAISGVDNPFLINEMRRIDGSPEAV